MSLGKNDKRWRCCFVTNSPMNILWKTSISWKLRVLRSYSKTLVSNKLLLLSRNKLGSCTLLQCLSVIASLETTSWRIDRFYDWLKAGNVYMPKVKLGYNADGLRGLVATEDIHCEEIFLKVPRERSLQVTEHEECTLSDFIDPDLWLLETWYVKLALKLWKERCLGDCSSWKPYMDILPSELNMGLVYWSDEDLAQLQYRPLIEEVERNKLYRKASYMRIVESIRFKLQDEDKNMFFWALDMVQSRAFGIPEDGKKIYALLPMMDMLNHRMNSQTHLLYDSTRNEYVMKTYSKLFQSKDIYISYGFVEKNNVYDNIQVKDLLQWLYLTYGNEWLSQPSHLLEEKLCVLTAHHVYESGKPFRIYYDRYEKEIDIVLRTLVASETDWKQIKENFALGLYDKAVSLENQLSVWQVVIDGCKQLLKDMKTSIEEDENILENMEPLPTKLRLAVQFRMEKKNILLATISRLEHFQKISKKTGRIITVWIPPSLKRITLQKYDI